MNIRKVAACFGSFHYGFFGRNIVGPVAAVVIVPPLYRHGSDAVNSDQQNADNMPGEWFQSCKDINSLYFAGPALLKNTRAAGRPLKSGFKKNTCMR